MQSSETLNAEFGISGQLKFRDDPGGLVVAEIDNEHATASLCLQGAHLMTWQPKSETEPVIWLSRDVNRRVSNRSAAQSIAFQAARSGAQQVSVGSLRGGGTLEIVIDEPAARLQAATVAVTLFDAFGVEGSVERVTVVGDTVTVEVTVSDPAGDATGVGSAQARTGP